MEGVLFMSDTLPVISYVIFTHLDSDNHIETVQVASLEKDHLLIKDFIGTVTEEIMEGIVDDSSYRLEVAERSLEAIANHLRHYLNNASEKFSVNLYIDVLDIGALSFFYELVKGKPKWFKSDGACIITQVRSRAGSNSTVNAIRVLEKVREIGKQPPDDFIIIKHYPSHL